MNFPWRDWQFWVVTALCLAAIVWMVRSLLPRSLRGAPGRRATLTIGGKAVENHERKQR